MKNDNIKLITRKWKKDSMNAGNVVEGMKKKEQMVLPSELECIFAY